MIMLQTFQTTYILVQHISIEEAICPWRGWLGFKVYMRDKPVKWVIKLYALCESQSGYVGDLKSSAECLD